MSEDSAPSLRLLARRVNEAEAQLVALHRALGLIDGCLASRDYNTASALARRALRAAQSQELQPGREPRGSETAGSKHVHQVEKLPDAETLQGLGRRR